MMDKGYSPSVRLFEAAGCGAAIISDRWAGIETFLVPGEEILLAQSGEEVIRYLREIGEAEAHAIGVKARERVLAEHTAEKRAAQFESFIGTKALAQNFA
jgi:spore maturation protein CgeB